MKWWVHVARMGEMICAYRLFVGKPKEKDHMEDLGLDVVKY
jgi:hypothetical protein